MKENVIDVLMYLFETYVDTEEDPEPNQNELRLELLRAGFGDNEIERALVWLDGLTGHQESLNYGNLSAHGTIFTMTSSMSGSMHIVVAISFTSNKQESCRHHSVNCLLIACWRSNLRILMSNRSNGLS